MKESGLGREGSKYRMADYIEMKYLCFGGIISQAATYSALLPVRKTQHHKQLRSVLRNCPALVCERGSTHGIL